MNIEAISRGVPISGIDPLSRVIEGVPVRDIITAVQAANRTELYGQDREVSFTRDEETRRVVIQIRDKNGELVHQIPPKELLQITNALQNSGKAMRNR